MKQYNIGDKVWLPICGTRQKYNPCPICAQKKKVKLTLGSGEECFLDCGYCSSGYNPPSGLEMEYESFAEPKQCIVSKFETDGKTVSYSFDGGYYADQGFIFETKEEAEVQCLKTIAEKGVEEQKRLEWSKEKDKKSYSWNAGYHRREAKEHERKMNYHKTKAQFMAAKSKDVDLVDKAEAKP